MLTNSTHTLPAGLKDVHCPSRRVLDVHCKALMGLQVPQEPDTLESIWYAWSDCGEIKVKVLMCLIVQPTAGLDEGTGY